MCEIFFLYGRNGEIQADSLEKLLKTALNAAERNSDGFGIFNEKKQVFKTGKKLKNGHIPNLVNEYSGSKFVVIHLRLATTGSVCQANSHPFTHDNNHLVHNGVVRNYDEYAEDRADSYHMLRQTLDNREDGDTVTAIEDTMDEISGRVSVFLHDNNYNLYYFRNKSKFTFAHNPVTNEYVGATKGKRLDNVWDDNIGHVEYFDNLAKKDPEEGNILQISDENIEKVGEFNTYSYNTGSKTRSRRTSTQTSTSSGKTSNGAGKGNTSNTTDEIGSATVLQEKEAQDVQEGDVCTLPNEEEDNFSQREYEEAKTGMTEDEWEEYMQMRAKQYEEKSDDAYEEMYGLEKEIEEQAINNIPYEAYPEHVAEEVYDKKPTQDPDLKELDEQEYWEQKEIEMFENQQDNQEESRAQQVQDELTPEDTGLKQLFEGNNE